MGVYFVFSWREDKHAFETQYGNASYKSIVLEDHMDETLIRRSVGRRNIVSFKKFFALTLLTEYEYVIAIDADAKFNNLIHVYPLCKQFCSARKIVSYRTTPYLDTINQASFDFLARRCNINSGELASKVDIHQYFWSLCMTWG